MSTSSTDAAEDGGGPEEAAATAPDPGDRASFPGLRSLPRYQQLWLLGLTIALIVAGGIEYAALVAEHRAPVGDTAVIAEQARTAWSAHPLVGQGSTAYVYGNPFSSHPGPILFYAVGAVMAVLGAVNGSIAFALLTAFASIMAAMWGGVRLAGFRGAIVFLGAGVAVAATAIPGLIWSINITYVCVLPLFAAFVLAACVAEGDWLALPALVVAATFVAQTETVFILPLLPVVVVAPIAGVWRSRSIGGWPTAVAAGLALVLWWPPIYDQLSGTGNFGKLLTSSIPSRGLTGVSQAWGTAFVIPPPLGRQLLVVEELRTFGVQTVLVLALLGGLLWWRRVQVVRHVGVIAVIAAVTVGMAAAGASLPETDESAWHFLWLRTGIVFLIAALGTVLADGCTIRSRWGRIAVSAVALIVGVDLLVDATAAPSMGVVNDLASSSSNELAPVVADDLEAGDEITLAYRGLFADTMAPPLALRLAEAGRPVTYTRQPSPTTDDLLVVTRGGPIDLDGAELVARVAPQAGAAQRRQALADLTEWARGQDLELTVDAATDLPPLVDGLVPEVCLEEVLEDPAQLAELPPEVLAGLLYLNRVSSPALPADLQEDVWAWAEGLGVEVWRVPLTASMAQDRDLLLSESSC